MLRGGMLARSQRMQCWPPGQAAGSLPCRMAIRGSWGALAPCFLAHMWHTRSEIGSAMLRGGTLAGSQRMQCWPPGQAAGSLPCRMAISRRWGVLAPCFLAHTQHTRRATGTCSHDGWHAGRESEDAVLATRAGSWEPARPESLADAAARAQLLTTAPLASRKGGEELSPAESPFAGGSNERLGGGGASVPDARCAMPTGSDSEEAPERWGQAGCAGTAAGLDRFRLQAWSACLQAGEGAAQQFGHHGGFCMGWHAPPVCHWGGLAGGAGRSWAAGSPAEAHHRPGG